MDGVLASLNRGSVVSIRVASDILELTEANVPAGMALAARVPWADVANALTSDAAAVPALVMSANT